MDEPSDAAVARPGPARAATVAPPGRRRTTVAATGARSMPDGDPLPAARRGDPAAWGVIYDALAPRILGYLRAQRASDPDDLTGEVLLQVVRDLDGFDGDLLALRSWALTIAHHRLVDTRRRDARRPSVPVAPERLRADPAPDDPVAEALGGVGATELVRRLDVLTDEQRDVLLLRTFGDLSIREVARLTDRTPGAVKQLQHRAVTVLREELDR